MLEYDLRWYAPYLVAGLAILAIVVVGRGVLPLLEDEPPYPSEWLTLAEQQQLAEVLSTFPAR